MLNVLTNQEDSVANIQIFIKLFFIDCLMTSQNVSHFKFLFIYMDIIIITKYSSGFDVMAI